MAPRWQDLPISPLTGGERTGARAREHAEGVQGYLPKSFTVQELDAAVEASVMQAGCPGLQKGVERSVRNVDQQYLLPVLAVVETLKNSPEVVRLQAHLPSVPGISKQACYAQMVLGQGDIASCTIIAQTGQVLLQQQEAYQALVQCGDVQWRVFSASGLDTSVGPRSHLARGSGLVHQPLPIPCLRWPTVPPATLAAFSHAYRQVLVLVDGKRSIDEIARLLKKTPQEVQQMLAAMEGLVQL